MVSQKQYYLIYAGHGHFDMKAYGDYFDNNLAEDKYDEAGVNKALEEH